MFLLNLLKWDGGVSTYTFDDILLTGDEGGVGESKLIIDMSVMNVKCLYWLAKRRIVEHSFVLFFWCFDGILTMHFPPKMYN